MLGGKSWSSNSCPRSKQRGIRKLDGKTIPVYFEFYICFNTVNVCKSRGGIFTMLFLRGYIGWKRFKFTSLEIIKNGIIWKSLGGRMMNVVPQEVSTPKTFGPWSPFGFWPCNSLGKIFTTLLYSTPFPKNISCFSLHCNHFFVLCTVKKNYFYLCRAS